MNKETPNFKDYLNAKLDDQEFASEFKHSVADVRFAVALAEAREARGMTQAQLSDATKIKQPMLSRYERGQIPEIPTLQKIAAALNLQITIKSDGTLAVDLV